MAICFIARRSFFLNKLRSWLHRVISSSNFIVDSSRPYIHSRSESDFSPLPWHFFLVNFLIFLLITSICQAETTTINDPLFDGQPIDISSDSYQKLFSDLREQHGFSAEQLKDLFHGLTIKKSILNLMSKPGEAKPYYQYRRLFVTPAMILAGKAMLVEHKALLDQIEQQLGVEGQYVLAIWGIETRFGQRTGQYNVFQTLNTLFAAYPRRTEFFRQELIEFLLLCREQRWDPLHITGSYAGAFGQTQFIPSSYRKYAISFDGDNHPDVFASTADVLASIAHYLKKFGWVAHAPLYHDIGTDLLSLDLIKAYSAGRNGRISWQQIRSAQGVSLPRPEPEQNLAIVGLEIDPSEGGGLRYLAAYPNFQAIVDWNHSNRYAMAVCELAEAFMR